MKRPPKVQGTAVGNVLRSFYKKEVTSELLIASLIMSIQSPSSSTCWLSIFASAPSSVNHDSSIVVTRPSTLLPP